MAPLKDIKDQKFGRLTAIEPTSERINKSVVWRCRCECGNTCRVTQHCLKNDNTHSCGCAPRGRQTYDLAGQKFACMTVMRHDHNGESGAVWRVKTDCGTEKLMARRYLIKATRGCRRKECKLK